MKTGDKVRAILRDDIDGEEAIEGRIIGWRVVRRVWRMLVCTAADEDGSYTVVEAFPGDCSAV